LTAQGLASYNRRPCQKYRFVAGWSSLAARRAHNPKVVGSNPAPATNLLELFIYLAKGFRVVGFQEVRQKPRLGLFIWLKAFFVLAKGFFCFG
jgi:hypothetical protein